MSARQSQSSQNLENIVNRYDRQQLIEGWQQEKLENAKVAVIGSDILANFTALALAALGFGTIEIYGQGIVTEQMLANYERNSLKPDYSQGFLYFDSEAGESKAEAIASFIKKVNPLVDTYGINIDMSKTGNIAVLGSPDIIFDATNDPASKIAAIEYAEQKKVPLISMSSSLLNAGIGTCNPASRADKRKLISNIVFAEFKDKAQGTTTSQLISSIGVDEGRKYIMPLKNEKVISDLVVYNLCSDKRFDQNIDRAVNGDNDLSDKSIIMVGAGALGNFTALDFALNNAGRLYVVDFDKIEPTNLNRQIWFYDAVGEHKAKALAEKLKKINPRVKFTAHAEKITPESEAFFKDAKADLIVDTVDNNKTRALVNYFSLLYKTPFISGGTRHDSGQVVVSIPGITACLNCQAGIDKSALNAYQPHQSCIYAPQPSVITSNQIVAALIGGEAKTVLQPDKYGDPIHSVLKYVSGEQYRLASLPTQNSCNCHENKKMLNAWKGKMAHLYKEE